MVMTICSEVENESRELEISIKQTFEGDLYSINCEFCHEHLGNDFHSRDEAMDALGMHQGFIDSLGGDELALWEIDGRG